MRKDEEQAALEEKERQRKVALAVSTRTGVNEKKNSIKSRIWHHVVAACIRLLYMHLVRGTTT